MYLTCTTCKVREHISEWVIFPIQTHIVKAMCPTCKKSDEYALTI